MTDAEKQQQKDAESVAEWLLLLLLLGGEGVTFNKALGRFYVDGKSVSVNTIRGYLLRIERRVARRIEKLVDDLEAGNITLEAYQAEFNRNISSTHILAGALTLGGIAAAVRNKTVQRQIRIEQKYGERFTKQIGKGKAGTWARIRARAKSYTKAASITYANVSQEVHKLTHTECRRVRRASESCPGCIEWSYRWMPIAKMPKIGALDCKNHCRCYLEFR